MTIAVLNLTELLKHFGQAGEIKQQSNKKNEQWYGGQENTDDMDQNAERCIQ